MRICFSLQEKNLYNLKMLEIDGSVLEGGGQILRISVSLSAILGIPIKVTKIRAGRPKPGLAAQHLKGITLVGEMCQARLKGASLGSTEIEFVPAKIRGQHYLADIKTAGSVNLLLQVALPCALMADAPVTLDLRGGTDVDLAPQVDYMTNVFRPALNLFQADFNLDIHRRGYFPKGGGHVTVDVNPVRKFHCITVTDPGVVTKITGYSSVTGLPLKIAECMIRGATPMLRDLCKDMRIEPRFEDHHNNDRCARMLVKCTTSNGCVLAHGVINRPRQDALWLGESAGARLSRAVLAGACLDDMAQDQVIVYMALADGKSSIRVGDITKHTETAIYIAELITKTKFTIVKKDDGNIIECIGIGFINKNIPE